MKIKVKLEASENTGHATFTLDELNLTKEEWDQLSDMEKQEAVKEAVNNLSEQPYWCLDKFEERS